MTNENKNPIDERSPELKSDLEAQPDDLGTTRARSEPKAQARPRVR